MVTPVRNQAQVFDASHMHFASRVGGIKSLTDQVLVDPQPAVLKSQVRLRLYYSIDTPVRALFSGYVNAGKYGLHET